MCSKEALEECAKKSEWPSLVVGYKGVMIMLVVLLTQLRCLIQRGRACGISDQPRCLVLLAQSCLIITEGSFRIQLGLLITEGPLHDLVQMVTKAK